MLHMVNKAHTRWVAANLGRCSALKAAVWATPMAFGQGVVVMGGYWSCPAMQCGTTALTHIR